MKMNKRMVSPGKAAALSILAMVLVVAMPAVMAMVEQDASYDVETPIEYDEKKFIIEHNGAYNTPEGGTWYPTHRGDSLNIFYPSETGGTYMIDSGQGSALTRMIIGLNHDNPVKNGEVRTMIMTTPLDLSWFSYVVKKDTVIHEYKFVQESPGVWIREFTSAEVLIIKGVEPTAEYFTVQFKTPSVDGIVEFGLDMYGADTSVYYASIVAGVCGVLLIVCALYMTPLVQIGTIPRAIGNGIDAVQNGAKKLSKRMKNKKKRGGN